MNSDNNSATLTLASKLIAILGGLIGFAVAIGFLSIQPDTTQFFQIAPVHADTCTSVGTMADKWVCANGSGFRFSNAGTNYQSGIGLNNIMTVVFTSPAGNNIYITGGVPAYMISCTGVGTTTISCSFKPTAAVCWPSCDASGYSIALTSTGSDRRVTATVTYPSFNTTGWSDPVAGNNSVTVVVDSYGAPCSCGAWVDGSCGAGGCSSDTRQQTRTCTPAACDTQSQCVADATCTHKICSGGNCITTAGAGVDECSVGSQCQHKDCSGSTCATILTPGVSTCGVDGDCNASVCPTCVKNPQPETGTLTCLPGTLNPTSCSYSLSPGAWSGGNYVGNYSFAEDAQGATGHKLVSFYIKPGSGWTAIEFINRNKGDLTPITLTAEEMQSTCASCGTACAGEEVTFGFTHHLLYPSACNVETHFTCMGGMNTHCIWPEEAVPPEPFCGGIGIDSSLGASGVSTIRADCPSVCGDGKVGGTEQCDDGNSINDDGCSNACELGHKECVGGVCDIVGGAGADLCTNDSECTYYACASDNTCTCSLKADPLANGSTPDECTPDPVTGLDSTNCTCSHGACGGSLGSYTCTLVNGPGVHQCDVVGDCGNAWFKATDGHIYGKAGVSNMVPATEVMVSDSSDPEVDYDAIDDKRGGFVCSSNSSISTNMGKVSERESDGSDIGWNALNFGDIKTGKGEEYSYDWFVQKFGGISEVITDPSEITDRFIDCVNTDPDYCVVKADFTSPMDISIANDFLLGLWNNHILPIRIVFFIDGDLIIRNDYVPTGVAGGFPVNDSDCGPNGENCVNKFMPQVAYIVKGNIYVDADVRNIYGLFFTDGKFTDGIQLVYPLVPAPHYSVNEEPNPDNLRKKLWIFGSVIAKGDNLSVGEKAINLHREVNFSQPSAPAEQVVINPAYYFTLSKEWLLGEYTYSWKE